ncbi:Mobile element protein [Candidatus Enterovibrio altilux]|uniref:Mobile element protein n=1 Tax=Candidatus Enterovibrio altilux TaxID=1927128 RepID=A0A291BAD0_9GAMM|nr:Mobile element protein [Candidatus Enterovibrio luxaltus]
MKVHKKIKKHSTHGKQRIWLKLHLTVDINTHEIISAALGASNVIDGKIPLNLLK